MTSDIRYVVAWAGDKRSQDALALGTVLARTFEASLDIVYVLHAEEQPSLHHAGESNFLDRASTQIQERLHEAAAGCPQDIEVRTHLRVASSITAGLLEACHELDAALVVIGAGSGAGQPLASPIVGSLLHASPVPVAMAPRGYRRNSFERLGELACAVGTRPGAHQVIEEAVQGVTRVGLPLRLVSLVDLEGRDRKAGKASKAEAARRLEEAKAAVSSRCTVTTEIGKGKDLRSAVKRIDWAPRSALIIGSSRLAAGNRTFLGTTATRMLTNLPIPMIVVPAADGS